jgi:hypothetical protein
MCCVSEQSRDVFLQVLARASRGRTQLGTVKPRCMGLRDRDGITEIVEMSQIAVVMMEVLSCAAPVVHRASVISLYD